VAHIREELSHFETFQNTRIATPSCGSGPPGKCMQLIGAGSSPTGSPWTARGCLGGRGQVSFIRLTDDRGQMRFFSEAFLVDPALVHEYVKGTITTRAGMLTFVHQGHRVKRYPYITTKSFEAS
jgi:hypothetical protein